MKRILNGVGIVLATLILVVIWLFLSRVIWLQFNHHYKPMPQGYRYGHLRMTAVNWEQDRAEGEFFAITIQARSDLDWTWSPPEHLRYPLVKLSGSPKGHDLMINTAAGTYTAEGQSGSISPQQLALWMTGSAPMSEQDRSYRNAVWLISILDACQAGRLPSPQHHPYSNESLSRRSGMQVPDGIRITILHGLPGMAFWWLDWVVIVGTIPGVWWIVMRRRSSMPLTPTKDAA